MGRRPVDTPTEFPELNNDTDWQLRAGCNGVDTDVFFWKPYKKIAQTICWEDCPVRVQCLLWARENERADVDPRDLDENGVPHGAYTNRERRDGIFGGHTAIERWRMDFPKAAELFAAREAERRERQRAERAKESPEERAARRARVNAVVASETPEQRATRLQKRRLAENLIRLQEAS